jgi:prepilin-type N-terminal cleavage/methylation domain-containing protein
MKPRKEIREAGRLGFTLVELLVVLGIISLLLFLASSALSGPFGLAFDSSSSDLANTLVGARAYAMANNTYVFVGIEEVDASIAGSATQTAGTGHYGRLGVVVVATSDGSRGYDPTSAAAGTTIPDTSLPAYANTQLVVVAPLRHFDNMHLIALTAADITAFGTNYPIKDTTGDTIPFYDLATASSDSALTFNWPLGAAAAVTQYTFGTDPGTIIQFNPQGEAQIITGANTSSYLQRIELDLVPTHGNVVPTTAILPNQASILIDGASGAVSLYRT